MTSAVGVQFDGSKFSLHSWLQEALADIGAEDRQSRSTGAGAAMAEQNTPASERCQPSYTNARKNQLPRLTLLSVALFLTVMCLLPTLVSVRMLCGCY